MNQAERMARAEAINDAIRAASFALGGEDPAPQSTRIIQALKAMQDDRAFVPGSARIDYLERAQTLAHAAWTRKHGTEPALSLTATAGIKTPLGVLSCSTGYRKMKCGALRKESLYELDGKPITVREIKKSGLARRPTTRNRKPKRAR